MEAMTAPVYVTQRRKSDVAKLAGDPVIRSYRDSVPWFGENRDHATLLSMGKVPGVDYFLHPLADLAAGIPGDTSVILLPSNGVGNPTATSRQNGPLAQANLAAFLDDGGTVIVDMGDNDGGGGYRAPGASGTPNLVFPSPCDKASLAAAALGPDGILGTADDHPIVKGPDGIPGTADDLDNDRIDLAQSCFIAHGNLADGITLPPDATILATATFGGVEKPILAEYCHNGGRVIVDTLTKEFGGQNGPAGPGNGATFFMTNLFHYALSPAASCGPIAVCENITVDADESCQACGSIDGGSFDPQGGPVSLAQSPACPYGLGDSNVTLTVSNEDGASATCTATVTVRDVTPPSAEVGDMVLLPFPRDYQMYQYNLSDCAAITADNCDAALDIDQLGQIVSISADEPDVYYGGDPAGDIEIVDHSTFRLRDQRDSYGNGRVYRVNFTVADNAGNASGIYTCTFGVRTFYDGGCFDTPIDDGDLDNVVYP